jgi:hypothetical protein
MTWGAAGAFAAGEGAVHPPTTANNSASSQFDARKRAMGDSKSEPKECTQGCRAATRNGTTQGGAGDCDSQPDGFLHNPRFSISGDPRGNLP